MAAALAFVPTPYSLILPGEAVNLRQVITVSGRPAPQAAFYLTDVAFEQNASPLLLLQSLFPGTRVVRTSDVVPSTIDSSEYQTAMRDAMTESQSVAAVVAERAARLPIGVPKSSVQVQSFAPQSVAQMSLRAGDILLSVEGKPTPTMIAVQHALARTAPGATISIEVLRQGMRQRVTAKTVVIGGVARLGIYLISQTVPPKLPLPVDFNLQNVSGSSGGLMFALDIYRTLVHKRPLSVDRIAGTGTLSYDGLVGPIEGAAQKVIAARKAGAQLFFVPRENYAEIAATPHIRIIPVTTFAQALRALE
ncbi:MAG: PDZ domain-containing protein [Candidatus Baltobacteraceae bacterium]